MSEGKLTIVGIEIPDGMTAINTKMKLSDGSYLSGIKSIKLEASVDNPVWTMSLEMIPRFDNQEAIQAVLKELKVSGDETTETQAALTGAEET